MTAARSGRRLAPRLFPALWFVMFAARLPGFNALVQLRRPQPLAFRRESRSPFRNFGIAGFRPLTTAGFPVVFRLAMERHLQRGAAAVNCTSSGERSGCAPARRNGSGQAQNHGHPSLGPPRLDVGRHTAEGVPVLTCPARP